MQSKSLKRGALLIAAGAFGLIGVTWIAPAVGPERASADAAGGQGPTVVRSANEDTAPTLKAGAVEARAPRPRLARQENSSGSEYQTPRGLPRSRDGGNSSETPTQQDDEQTDELTRAMLRQHMGLSDDEADEWAESMGQMMKAVHGDQADEMLENCAQQGGAAAQGTNGPSTGNGTGNRSRGGMMGGAGGGMMGSVIGY